MAPTEEQLARLTAAIDYQEEHPDEANQGVWGERIEQPGGHCGTACCVAGRIVVQAGGTLVFEPGRTVTEEAELDGRTVYIEDAAATLIGVDMDTAAHLFGASNTITHLREMAVVLERDGFINYDNSPQTPNDD